MKRGVTGSLDLYKWQSEIRNGDQKAVRNVTIVLHSGALRMPVPSAAGQGPMDRGLGRERPGNQRPGKSELLTCDVGIVSAGVPRLLGWALMRLQLDCCPTFGLERLIACPLAVLWRRQGGKWLISLT